MSDSKYNLLIYNDFLYFDKSICRNLVLICVLGVDKGPQNEPGCP